MVCHEEQGQKTQNDEYDMMIDKQETENAKRKKKKNKSENVERGIK